MYFQLIQLVCSFLILGCMIINSILHVHEILSYSSCSLLIFLKNCYPLVALMVATSLRPIVTNCYYYFCLIIERNFGKINIHLSQIWITKKDATVPRLIRIICNRCTIDSFVFISNCTRYSIFSLMFVEVNMLPII